MTSLIYTQMIPNEQKTRFQGPTKVFLAATRLILKETLNFIFKFWRSGIESLKKSITGFQLSIRCFEWKANGY